MFGTIEPRKRHALVLDAFEDLLFERPQRLRLAFAGGMGWIDKGLAARIRYLSQLECGFRYLPGPDDASLRRLVLSAAATIFVSAAEGYGLPVAESLWLGVPVITNRATPSLEDIGGCGVRILDQVSVDDVRRAAEAFLDPVYAMNKRREARRLNLPDWRSFSEQVANWLARPESETSEPREFLAAMAGHLQAPDMPAAARLRRFSNASAD
jgi:glycosyltransferase involved in cell wall biosynthesis